MLVPSNETVQESPMSTGLKSPGSPQWRTPIKTPNTTWGWKEMNDSAEKEIVSDDDVIDEDKMDLNCPVIPVTREEKERLQRHSLIIKVLGRKVSYSYLL